MPRKILILGASYGSLLGAKLALAGHTVKLVCLPQEAELINAEGARVRLPARDVDGLVDLDTTTMSGNVSAGGTGDVDPTEYDLVGLAMQEPQYRSPDVHDLLKRVAAAKVPCMSIMNMPPLTYLKRIPSIDTASLTDCYTDASVWDDFDPSLMTLCSPDPQAFRPPEEKVNVLQVGLPTNFKSAHFDAAAHTGLLRELEGDIAAIRYDVGGRKIDLPVKLRVHDSVFVPLAKWCMLMAGNYRCVRQDSMTSIEDAVHTDLKATEAVYNWVVELCLALGAGGDSLVPFEKYANAALSLRNPSSAARALANGAPYIERVDRLIQKIAAQHGMQSDVADETVALVDGWLEANRQKV